MVRTYKQKNRYCRDTKLSEPVYLCLARLFSEGHTETMAARIMRRWCARYGDKPVSRQAINGHFQRFGQYLWILIFKNPDQDFPYDKSWTGYKDLSFLRELVYFPGDSYERRLKRITLENKRNRELFSKHDPMILEVDPSDSLKSEEITVLYKVSQELNGIPDKTFYVYWARAYWIADFKRKNKGLTDRGAYTSLFEKMVDAFLSPLRNLPNMNRPGQQRFFLYGISLIRIYFSGDSTPEKAERYFFGEEPVIDNTVIMPILTEAPDDLAEITPLEFLFLFDQMRDMDANTGSLALKKGLERLRQRSLGVIDKTALVKQVRDEADVYIREDHVR